MIPLRSLMFPVPFLFYACTTASGTFAPLGEDHPASAKAPELPVMDPAAFLRATADAPPTEEAEASADSPSLAPVGAYVCPMHPEVSSEEPGLCSKCGMKLVLREGAEEQHEEHPHDG